MGTVFAELFDFVVFENAEGFAGEVGVEDVAEFVAEVGTALWVPDAGVAVVAHVLGEGLEIPDGVGEFEDARGDEVYVGAAYSGFHNHAAQ